MSKIVRLMIWSWLTDVHVSGDWLRDHARRSSQRGIDQSRWAVWPWRRE